LAKPPEIEQAGVNDLDGLEVWGGLADATPDDADVYSLLGGPLINGTRTSLWYYNGSVTHIPHFMIKSQ
jgi:hypothetical protein